MSKTHASLRLSNNILFIILWAVAASVFLFILEANAAITLAIVGGGFGAIAGLMQHMSLAQATDKFATASSLLGVRRAFTGTSWGSRYILWLYICKLALIVIAFGLIRRPLLRVAVGYLGAYTSLMFVRELVTLRDVIAVDRLAITDGNNGPDVT